MLYLCAMKNEVYTRLGKLLKEWRKKSGLTLYRIEREVGGAARYDSLKRVEEGKGVTSGTLLCYVDFAYRNGFRVFDELYNKDLLQQSFVVPEEKEKGTFETSEPVSEKTIPEAANSSDQTEENPSEEELSDAQIKEFDNMFLAMTKEKLQARETLSDCEQKLLIQHGQCPRCGRVGQFIEKISRNTGNPYCSCPDCKYWFFGTQDNPEITKEYLEGVEPLGQ